MAAPKLFVSSPRLTEDLKGPKHPHFCQNCGVEKSEERKIDLFVWQEHDHNDMPEYRVVILCKGCSDLLIEPHVRMYHRFSQHVPYPGIMEICIDCQFRFENKCTHPRSKSNGGEGVKIDIESPSVAFVDGSKFRGRVVNYYSPARSCEQKQSKTS